MTESVSNQSTPDSSGVTTNPQSLLAGAVAALNQAADLVASLTDDQYSAVSDEYHASIGQHLRHALDHFRALTAGYENDQTVSYDQRQRGTPIESDRAAAAELIDDLRARVEGLDEVQMSFDVRIAVMTSAEGDEAEITSTLARELAFVTHHAIHHYALVKPICREHKVTVPEELGRAPSTVKNDRG